jgi:peptide/nickel transport system ATP-binding protein/oligopeptide transport system ATP-binding protein
MAGASMLSVENALVHFPSGQKGQTVKAVDGVSFSVRQGETFGVIGESGSGKSTLGRVLVCLENLGGGRIKHNGIDPFEMSAGALRKHRRNFQMIAQDPHSALNPRMTIAASIREPLDVTSTGTPATRRQAVAQLLDRVGLRPEIGDRYPHQLSGGQKQRINIARALALRPNLVVCDEVVAALDASVRADILNLLMDLQAEFGLTYVFITHDLSVVSHISDRIAVMYLGRFVEVGGAAALVEAPMHPYTKALLSAEPVLFSESNRIVLEGEIPSPIDLPSGCRFRTRCPLATEVCAQEEPDLAFISGGHQVACHHAGEAISS